MAYEREQKQVGVYLFYNKERVDHFPRAPIWIGFIILQRKTEGHNFFDW